MTDLSRTQTQDIGPEAPTSQTQGTPASAPPDAGSPAPTSGRQSFRDIRRQLTDDELSSPGAQKLILEELERAEATCNAMQGYVERYHDADRRAAVWEERNRGITALEICFAVGIGIGGVIIGLAPLFWNDQSKGSLALAIGVVLVIGACAARVVKR